MEWTAYCGRTEHGRKGSDERTAIPKRHVGDPASSGGRRGKSDFLKTRFPSLAKKGVDKKSRRTAHASWRAYPIENSRNWSPKRSMCPSPPSTDKAARLMQNDTPRKL